MNCELVLIERGAESTVTHNNMYGRPVTENRVARASPRRTSELRQHIVLGELLQYQ